MSAAVDLGAVAELLHRMLADQADLLSRVREVQSVLEHVRQGQAELADQVRALDLRTTIRPQSDGPPAAAQVTAGERWLTAAEVSQRLDRHPDTVREDLRSGRLPGTKVGRSWRVRTIDLDRHLEAEGAAEREDRDRLKGAREWARSAAAAQRSRPARG